MRLFSFRSIGSGLRDKEIKISKRAFGREIFHD